MKDTATLWKRFSDKLKGLINPRKIECVQDMPPPNEKEDLASQVESWEDEGGKSAGRAAIEFATKRNARLSIPI